VTIGYGKNFSSLNSSPDVYSYSRASEVIMAQNSLLSTVCELNENYPDGILEVPKKTQIDSLSNIDEISILGPVTVTATATLVKVVWSGSNSNLVTG
jgi:hypothetical protein